MCIIIILLLFLIPRVRAHWLLRITLHCCKSLSGITHWSGSQPKEHFSWSLPLQSYDPDFLIDGFIFGFLSHYCASVIFSLKYALSILSVSSLSVTFSEETSFYPICSPLLFSPKYCHQNCDNYFLRNKWIVPLNSWYFPLTIFFFF